MRFWDYPQRSELTHNSTAKKLLQIIIQKESNLAIALDVRYQAELLQLADLLGPEICVLKTHIDILEDFTADLPRQLQALADKHQFIIFEDRKFADIGHTVQWQYGGGIYHIADWSPITNAHVFPGPGIIAGLKQVGLPKGNGLLLLAEMSSAEASTQDVYVQQAIRYAKANRDFVIGFISQRCFAEAPEFLYLTPGIHLEVSDDALGQHYLTPQQAIVTQGSDVIIVGRGIYQAAEPLLTAKRYRAAGWQAYLTRQTNSAC